MNVDLAGLGLGLGLGLGNLYDFSAAKIFACVIFGAIGLAAFVYGKKNKLVHPLIVGIALMAYPYFFSSTLALYFVGIVLTAALYFWRD